MGSFSCTTIDIEQICHTWHIKNFGILRAWDMINGLKSNQFAGPGDSVDGFYIQIKVPDSYKMELELKRVNENQNPNFICFFDIRIGNIAISKEANGHKFCRISLYNLYETHKISPSDTLKIRCDLTVNVLYATINKLLNVPKPNIQNDLSTFLNSEEFADVKIVAGDGKEIHAHKIILSASSQVFNAMFKHPLKENQQNCVTISDYRNEVVLEMLRFIYTGCAPNLKDMTEELLSAADKYDLGRLKAMCLNSLKENLSDETAALTLKLADLYHEEELKSYVLEYIKNNRASVLKTSSWKSFATSDKILVLESFFLLKLDE